MVGFVGFVVPLVGPGWCASAPCGSRVPWRGVHHFAQTWCVACFEAKIYPFVALGELHGDHVLPIVSHGDRSPCGSHCLTRPSGGPELPGWPLGYRGPMPTIRHSMGLACLIGVAFQNLATTRSKYFWNIFDLQEPLTLTLTHTVSVQPHWPKARQIPRNIQLPLLRLGLASGPRPSTPLRLASAAGP